MSIRLSNVTLITVNTIEPELSIAALEHSAKGIEFAKKVLITCGYHKQHKGIEIVNIAPIDILGYSRFMLRELHKYVNTDFCIVIQTDGFIINGKKWSEEFLKYDYIGAPWPADENWIKLQPIHFQEKYRQNLERGWGRVGNGGFSMRSKKLLQLTAECPFETHIHPEDNYFALYHIDWFLEKGIRFAPVDVALAFSVENEVHEAGFSLSNSFGFHGRLTAQHKQAIKKLTEKKPTLWDKTVEPVKKIGRKVLSLRHFWANARRIQPPQVFKQSREFYFSIFKKQYERYRKWIEPGEKSDLPIDIIIPVIEKDLPTLPHVIRGVRSHVKHPIGNIYIVAPASELIMSCAKENNAVFINEQSICSITKAEINFVAEGINRSGWLYQQFLKLNFDKVGTCDNYLVVDADTVFIKDIQFEKKGKFYFDFSDEFHTPYYKAYEILTGFKHRVPVSFVAHYMIFNKQKLAMLYRHIKEVTGKKPEQAIIDLKMLITDKSNFSEYETYANYCIQAKPTGYRIRYWFNKSYNPDALQAIDKLRAEKEYKSISFHEYNIAAGN